MTNFFILFPIPIPTEPSISINPKGRKKADHRSICWIIASVAFLLLLSLGYVLYVLTPPAYGYKNFEKIGTVDCHISGSSEEGGYFFYLNPDRSSEVFITMVTKKRAKELDRLCQDDPASETLYRLDVYSTGTNYVYVSTYDGLSRKEAWKDYKTALRDNSLEKNGFEFGMAIFCSVILLITLIFLIRLLVSRIRNEKIEKVISSSRNRELAESLPDEYPEKEELENEALLESLDTNNNSWHK